MTGPVPTTLEAVADRFDRLLDRGGATADRHRAMTDLLLDALHWCDLRGEDFLWCLATALAHYHAERCGEPLRDRTPS